MPELPEVETVARGLRASVLGRRILSITLGKTDFIDNPEEIERELPGKTIEDVERYGKFMLLGLSNGGRAKREAALLVHLGMTGMLAPNAKAQPPSKHTHVTMALDDGRELRYTDARRFGRMAYLGGKALEEELERFGSEPLEVSEEEFAGRMGSRRARVKALLLDQSVLRGVGNIYADESLWRAKIHPARLGTQLRSEQLRTLRRVLQEVLQRAIAMRGSTISDFLDAEGEPGEYQRHHRAYGREGKACYRCKAGIRRTVVAGRSSYYCPKCQPAPRRAPKQTRRKKR